MIREQVHRAANGLLMLVVLVLATLFTLAIVLGGADRGQPGQVVLGLLLFAATATCFRGLFVIQPNEAVVLTLFGNYVGSVKQDGFWWTNPFSSRTRLSLRVRNFETAKLKVNDAHSNPIEIGAIVVWKVVETAEAVFEVDNYEEYVRIQSESALRTLAQRYPYDGQGGEAVALSTHTDEVSLDLLGALHERLKRAGVDVTEARISHLAYSPEIAAAMLQRQQASAIVAARRQIVEGAVGMVEDALQRLHAQQVVQLDDERKAAMVSNLLVVLCGDRGAQPVVNTGTLYQ